MQSSTYMRMQIIIKVSTLKLRIDMRMNFRIRFQQDKVKNHNFMIDGIILIELYQIHNSSLRLKSHFNNKKKD
jgi:hypothetical protein